MTQMLPARDQKHNMFMNELMMQSLWTRVGILKFLIVNKDKRGTGTVIVYNLKPHSNHN